MQICQDCGAEYCYECTSSRIPDDKCPCGGELRMLTSEEWLFLVNETT